MKLVASLIRTDNCTYTDYIDCCVSCTDKETLYDLLRIRMEAALDSQEGFEFAGETWNVFDNIYVPSTTRKQLMKHPELALALTDKDIQIKVQTLEEWWESNKQEV